MKTFRYLFFIAGFLNIWTVVLAKKPSLRIAPNQRYFITSDGKPFFWLGDTGWLLFKKLSKSNTIKYLDTRKEQGFNVVQVMLLHDLNMSDFEQHQALINNDISKPLIRTDKQHDYWKHVDFVIKEAEKRGIFMAIVPIWGSNIKKVNTNQIKIYASFLAKRYKNMPNIIWLNGGDVKANEAQEKWETLGVTLRKYDKHHLITYHPRGRTSSSHWFHNASWLDFNMIQSGHRSYAQDTSANEKLHYGEDNWRYIQDDYQLSPAKPTLDGEPSYEEIPYGLHYPDQSYWQDYEIRRYAYWSVFSGGAGFTYGHNAVMQFYCLGDSNISYFPKTEWTHALLAKGAGQMQFLKNLMIERDFQRIVPAQELIANNLKKYDRIVACKGKDFALIYTYNGRNFEISNNNLSFSRAFWYRPNNGSKIKIADYQASQNYFDPPGETANGNDWVLILEK